MGDAFVATSVEQIHWAGGLRVGAGSTTGVEVAERAIARAPGASGSLSLDEAKLAARASGSGGARFSSLYEALAAKREAQEAEAKERERTRFLPVGLDEDDAAFLAVQAADSAFAARSKAAEAGADRAAFEEAIAVAQEARVREDAERRKKALAAALSGGTAGGAAEAETARRDSAAAEAPSRKRRSRGEMETTTDQSSTPQQALLEVVETAAVARAAAAARSRNGNGGPLPPPSSVLPLHGGSGGSVTLSGGRVDSHVATAATPIPPRTLPPSAMASLVDYADDA